MKNYLGQLLAAVLAVSANSMSGQEARFFRILSSAPTAITACTADGHVTWTNAAPGLICTVQTATALAPGNWTDYVQVPASNYTASHRLFDPNPPSGMALIPAGSFQMGDSLDGTSSELPLHTVYVSAFYMDRYEVTKALWDEVYNWAIANGYSFDGAQGNAANHPVQYMTWYDAVKWCNARSQKEGLTPCYYADAGLTIIYKAGHLAPYVNWNAKGYRLPTEAEREKAARGGASGRRYPWSDTDNITHSRANYFSATEYSYDTSPTRGFHPTFHVGAQPYTSPVGYFSPNGYGLYDMAGNVWEWCWDWWSSSYYSSSPGTDPHGPTAGSSRVLRGGSWYIDGAFRCGTAFRGHNTPDFWSASLGFRAVLPSGQ